MGILRILRKHSHCKFRKLKKHWQKTFETWGPLTLHASPWEPSLGNLYLGTYNEMSGSAPKPLLWLTKPKHSAVDKKMLNLKGNLHTTTACTIGTSCFFPCIRFWLRIRFQMLRITPCYVAVKTTATQYSAKAGDHSTQNSRPRSASSCKYTWRPCLLHIPCQP